MPRAPQKWKGWLHHWVHHETAIQTCYTMSENPIQPSISTYSVITIFFPGQERLSDGSTTWEINFPERSGLTAPSKKGAVYIKSTWRSEENRVQETDRKNPLRIRADEISATQRGVCHDLHPCMNSRNSNHHSTVCQVS